MTQELLWLIRAWKTYVVCLSGSDDRQGNYYKDWKNCKCYVSKKNQETNIDHPRDHPRSIAFQQTNFSDCTVTDRGPHHRCCYLEKDMYARKSILKGSHHRRFIGISLLLHDFNERKQCTTGPLLEIFAAFC